MGACERGTQDDGGRGIVQIGVMSAQSDICRGRHRCRLPGGLARRHGHSVLLELTFRARKRPQLEDARRRDGGV